MLDLAGDVRDLLEELELPLVECLGARTEQLLDIFPDQCRGSLLNQYAAASDPNNCSTFEITVLNLYPATLFHVNLFH